MHFPADRPALVSAAPTGATAAASRKRGKNTAAADSPQFWLTNRRQLLSLIEQLRTSGEDIDLLFPRGKCTTRRCSQLLSRSERLKNAIGCFKRCAKPKTFRFAPEHQLILGKIAVSAHRDPHLGPAPPAAALTIPFSPAPPRGRPLATTDARHRSPGRQYLGSWTGKAHPCPGPGSSSAPSRVQHVCQPSVYSDPSSRFRVLLPASGSLRLHSPELPGQVVPVTQQRQAVPAQLR